MLYRKDRELIKSAHKNIDHMKEVTLEIQELVKGIQNGEIQIDQDSNQAGGDGYTQGAQVQPAFVVRGRS